VTLNVHFRPPHLIANGMVLRLSDSLGAAMGFSTCNPWFDGILMKCDAIVEQERQLHLADADVPERR
jgi:hypothetical protein